MTRIVGVHGVGNFDRYPSVDDAAIDLAWIWQRALLDHMPAGTVDLRMAYYADQVRPAPSLAAAVGQQLSGANFGQLAAWADALGAPSDAGRGHAALPPFVDWLAKRKDLDNALVRSFVTTFIGEVDRYLGAAETRLAVRRTVEAQVERHRPDVLIAHSLGSVVAYEALVARPDLHVDLFITVGSPLALDTVVYDRLPHDGEDNPSRRPNVGRWVNVADAKDLAAVPRSLAARFDVDTEHQEDLGLTALPSAVDYLRTPAVGALLATAA
ncbi:hypothetical protein [Dactylosporangium sp. NPDC005555]|uniref:hypothetical protein n=1 Tax=Dactylosporangium sp. NPDC005555 TaxID=3154889 RepID=UPI0033A201AC